MKVNIASKACLLSMIDITFLISKVYVKWQKQASDEIKHKVKIFWLRGFKIHPNLKLKEN